MVPIPLPHETHAHRSREQDLKAFLAEVMVIREHVGEALAAHAYRFGVPEIS
jgi:hypothetical protein